LVKERKEGIDCDAINSKLVICKVGVMAQGIMAISAPCCIQMNNISLQRTECTHHLAASDPWQQTDDAQRPGGVVSSKITGPASSARGMLHFVDASDYYLFKLIQ
jgi:hypothetical protein